MSQEIKKVEAYETSDKEVFSSLEKALEHQTGLNLESAFDKDPILSVFEGSASYTSFVDFIVKHKNEVVNFVNSRI